MNRLLHADKFCFQSSVSFRSFEKVCFGILIVLLLLPTLSSAEARKKILFVDSYHEEYIWSSDITTGIRSVLDLRPEVELKIFRMDTKRHMTESFKREAAAKARQLIESWHPDVVIAADDNAAKYLIAPYYKNAAIPFVFCGLNWDASVYGLPVDNVTGMLEVSLFEKTVGTLRQYAKGNRIGYLASDTISERKEYENIVKRFGGGMEAHFVSTFSELKQAYLDLQKRADMLILQECRSVKGFNHLGMIQFVREHTEIPTAAMQKYLNHYALFTYAKLGEEQGEYAAQTALDILDGADPKTIPVVENKQASTYLNMKLAKRMGIKFPIELVRTSHLISAEQKKLLYVNSYHTGYQWSDEIEMGLLKALNITRDENGEYDDSGSEVKLQVFRMDTKLHQSEKFKQQSALAAKTLIDDWQPDIIVTSDDNAVKYLVVPYLRGSDIPVVFCGVNWDSSIYNLTPENITGMEEVTSLLQTIELTKPYARGDRIGYIGHDTYTEEREVQYIEGVLHLDFTDGELAADFQQWQDAYLRLQKQVDILIFLSPVSLDDWSEDEANAFIYANAVIPSVSTGDNSLKYTLMGKVKIAEEQGWWAGNTVLRILEGTPVKNIPVTTNKNFKLSLNMKMAKKLGIKFPIELIETAVLVQD